MKTAAFSFFLFGIWYASVAADAQEFVAKDCVLQVVEQVDIPATANGKIVELVERVGAQVTEGQVVARIDNTRAKLELERARNDLLIATEEANSVHQIEFVKKSLDVAISDLERAQKSNRSYNNVVPPQEMDRLRLLVEKYSAEVEKLKFDRQILTMKTKQKQTVVEEKELNLEDHLIRASLAGRIINLSKQEGEWVDKSESVLTILRTDKLRIEVRVPLSKITSRFQSSAARFSPAHANRQNRSFRGTIVFVSPKVETLNNLVKVWIEFDNPEGLLRPGMKGTLKIGDLSVESAQAGN